MIEVNLSGVTNTVRGSRTRSASPPSVAALFAVVIAEAKGSERRGCFLCNAGADRTMIDPAISKAVSDAMQRLIMTFARRIGEDGPGYPAATALVASYIGVRILVRAGATFGVLEAAVDTLLARHFD